MNARTRVGLSAFALALLLAYSLASADTPRYFCVGPGTCTTITEITSWQYARDHLIVNGKDYGRVTATYSRDAVPASVVIPDEIFSSSFN